MDFRIRELAAMLTGEEDLPPDVRMTDIMQEVAGLLSSLSKAAGDNCGNIYPDELLEWVWKQRRRKAQTEVESGSEQDDGI